MTPSSASRLAAASLTLLLATAACFAGCRKGGGPSSEVFPGAPVVVISVDTLRSDHLPFYGYKGVETPALSALRADAILYERAYTHVPLTLPAHVSLFTGLLPDAHGVHDNLGYPLKPGIPTLAELLKKGGYRTGAAVSAYVLDGRSGLARGFDFYEDHVAPITSYVAPSLVQRHGFDTEALLERWVGSEAAGPLFAFLHLYEPHTPYDPPEPFKSRYALPYDGEIAAADLVVGRFLSFLKEKGIYDRALVIFLSDHGESLGEHGEDEHGVFLYRSALQIPLLVKLPGRLHAGVSVADPVQLADVFTTIGEATALPNFPRIEGNVSLVALAAGAKLPRRPIFAETFFPRIHFGWASLESVVDGTWHYIGAPRPEFYDLEKDPSEGVNLSDSKQGPLRAMKLELERRTARFEAPGAIGEEEKKKLASLGYLSTGSAAGQTGLPDPKDEIGTVRLLREAVGAARSQRPAEALAFFEQLLARNPSMLDVWELYADALLSSGRPEEALAARMKTVELSSPTSTIPLLSVANLCLQIGRPDEALRNAQLALERGDLSAHEALARVYLVTGDLAMAEREAREGLRQAKVERRSLLALAHVEVLRNDPVKALSFLERNLALGSEGVPMGVHFLKGDIFARQGRGTDALREFETEIRLFPSGTEARVGLVMVLGSTGRTQEAKRAVQEMIERVGTVEAHYRAYRALTFLKDRAGAERLRQDAIRLFPGNPAFRNPS